jgi:cytochrome b pre-mRNA-processing protein 3
MSLGLKRLNLFPRGRTSAGIAAALYGATVARAREPALYTNLAVPDSVEGRFEMVVLHTHLTVRRLMAAGETADLGQEVFDFFCADMDRSLRDLGVGDLSVPKKMRILAERYYGRAMAYETGLAAGDQSSVAAAITRNVFRGEPHVRESQALAAYALSAAAVLRSAADEALLAGRIAFPDPASFSVGGAD